MMVAHAALLLNEVALVVARSGDGHVDQGQHGDRVVLVAQRLARVADGDHPGPAAAVAEQVAVAARADHGVADAHAAQDGDRVVDRMALGEAAQVDAHAVAAEAQRARHRVERQVLPADRGAAALQRLGRGAGAGAVVVQVADAGEADVEGAAGETGELQRPLDQADQGPSIERVVWSKQQVARLTRAIEELPPKCRQVFLLIKFHHWTHAEVATRLGISQSTVVKHMIKAVDYCRSRLDEP